MSITGESILVRVPSDIKKTLVRLQKQENLPTLGVALKFLIEQATNERIEVELSKIRANQDRLCDAIVESHKKVNFLGLVIENLIEEFGGVKGGAVGGLVKIDKMNVTELYRKAGIK